MSDKNRNNDNHGVDATPEWHPYTVWQQKIRDAQPKSAENDQAPTGSWRADAVWKNLIKE